MTSQSFFLDLIPRGIAPIVHVSQYDKGQTWTIGVMCDGQGYSIPADSSVIVQGTKPDNTGFQYSCTYSGSTVTVTEEQQMTVIAGDVPAEIRISKDGDIIGSLNFIIRVEPAALSDDTVISETDLPLIEEAAEIIEQAPELINQMEDLVEDSEAWACGTKDGVPVPNTAPQYQNNAKFYAEQAGSQIGKVTETQWTGIQAILS